MRSTGALIHIMRRHDLVLESLPEILIGFFDIRTFKNVYVFDRDLISQCVHFEFQAVSLLIFRLVRVGIEEIVYLFVIKLNILDLNADFALSCSFSPFAFDLGEQLSDSPRDNAFFINTGFETG